MEYDFTPSEIPQEKQEIQKTVENQPQEEQEPQNTEKENLPAPKKKVGLPSISTKKLPQKEVFMHILSIFGLIALCGFYFLFDGGTELNTQETAQAHQEAGLLTIPNATDRGIAQTRQEAQKRINARDEAFAQLDNVQNRTAFDFWDNDPEAQANETAAEPTKKTDGTQTSQKGKSGDKKVEQQLNQTQTMLRGLIEEEPPVTTPEGTHQATTSSATKATGGATNSGAASSTTTDPENPVERVKRKQAQRKAELKRQEDSIMVAYGLAPASTTTDNENASSSSVKSESTEQTVQPAAAQKKKSGFNTLGGGSQKGSSNSIRAVVHGEHKDVRNGSIVKLRILEDLIAGNVTVPRNSFLYGKASFSSGRLMIKIDGINYNNNVLPFNGSIYDNDGFEGISAPDNVIDETKKEAGSSAVQGLPTSISGGGLIGSTVSAIGQAIKSSANQAIKDQKITISANYKLTIKCK